VQEMRYGYDILYFSYDANGVPQTVTHNTTLNQYTTVYQYVTNQQGDVIGIQDYNGNVYASYSYNAWGVPTSSSDSSSHMIEVLNPLRYRGYVYDQETGLYYLQSRYYNPRTGRFLNADAYASTGQDILGSNMFAYCGNNPIVRKDFSGTFWLSALVGAAVNVATTFIAAKVTGQKYTWRDAVVAAASGGANAIPVVGPLISGVITGGYTACVSYQNGATVGEALVCGTVAATCTTLSISNLANFQGPTLELATNAFVDLVFGTANNSISAAVYKAVVENSRTCCKPSKYSNMGIKSTSMINMMKPISLRQP